MGDDDDFDVTDEMIEAGVSAYYEYKLDYGTVEGRVEAIFIAMRRASPSWRGIPTTDRE